MLISKRSLVGALVLLFGILLVSYLMIDTMHRRNSDKRLNLQALERMEIILQTIGSKIDLEQGLSSVSPDADIVENSLIEQESYLWISIGAQGRLEASDPWGNAIYFYVIPSENLVVARSAGADGVFNSLDIHSDDDVVIAADCLKIVGK